MAEPREEPFLDDPEAVEEDFDLDAAMAEGPKEPGPNVDAIIAERDDYKDRFMRALADAENLRKRSERDRREAEQYGGSKLARDMMPVYDNLKRALDAGLLVTVNSDDPSYFGGYVNDNYLGIYEALNLTPGDLVTLAKNSFAASFIDDRAKQAGIDAVDAHVERFSE